MMLFYLPAVFLGVFFDALTAAMAPGTNSNPRDADCETESGRR